MVVALHGWSAAELAVQLATRPGCQRSCLHDKLLAGHH